MTKKTSSVRARALVHMQRLIATSAAVAAANEACHPKAQLSEGDAVPFGPPKAPDASDTPVADAADAAPVVAVPDANTTTTGRDHGYMVVDPVPRPAHCPNIAPKIHGKVARAGKNLVVTLSPADGRPDFTYVVGQTPTAYGGKIISAKIDTASAVVTVAPVSADYLSISVKGHCDKGFVTISAGIDSAQLSVSMSEY